MRAYFERLHTDMEQCYARAKKARNKGFDPSKEVEIPPAKDLAARVEQLVGPVGVAERIRQATKEIGDREQVAIQISKEVARGDFGRMHTPEAAIDQSVRTGLAILTEGVLVAPLEGIAEVKIKNNHDNTRYVDLFFAGPIRSAGGTGQAMSVLLADVVRREFGIAEFKPTDKEVERYKEEVPAYRQCASLQYTPSDAEVEAIVRGCPICIDGEGTEDEEIAGNRDLPRIETNRIRGGAMLVLAEGMCLKAPKIQKHVKRLKLEGWDFLDTLVNKGAKNDEEDKTEGGIPEIPPATKYIRDIIAGRPVLSHPSRPGGFRLRYGRARTAGLASTAINPATMHILDDFIAVGTQMKVERPGKGTLGTPCDSIEGPIVLLGNGDLVQVDTYAEAKKVRPAVSRIIDLGEILVPFGEFAENNALMPDASYSYEWWVQELQEKLGGLPEKNTASAIIGADAIAASLVAKEIGRETDLLHPPFEDALFISKKFGIPLHPDYTLFWHDITPGEVMKLSAYLRDNGTIAGGRLSIPADPSIKDTLITLCALHVERDGMYIFDRHADTLLLCLGLEDKAGQVAESGRFPRSPPDGATALGLVSAFADITIMPKAPFRIGARMGRPEKADARKMQPPPHILYPIGDAGGNQRLLREAAAKGLISVEVGNRRCESCGAQTHRTACRCGGHTTAVELAPGARIEKRTLELGQELREAQRRIGEPILPETIKAVIGVTSRNKTPELLEKGILRAKHGIYVFKDGTIRFDMTDAPLTHFKPCEIGTTVERLRELGYAHDNLGDQLERDDQTLELFVQDIIPSKSCGTYLLRAAKFVDDLLEKLYGEPRFYNATDMNGLVGHFTIGLAPHTSGGVLSRIIGYVDAQVCYGHPFFHAAKRRNCDGDEDAVMLLMDGLLNFSRSYIPDKRGGRMDLPLVLTTRLDPSEIDKEAHNVDCLSRYPLELYRATQRHAHPKEVEKLMDTVSGRLGTPSQYEGFGFTNDTADIAEGPSASAYKTLGDMRTKMEAQLELGRKIRAVDEADVASRIIGTHFLPDLLGNLKSFSKQTVRCPACNRKFRRPPIKGVCLKCGGKLTLTVHEGSVKKYLEISKEIGEKYGISDYTKQRIQVVESSINSLFNNDKVKKSKLSDFF
ncbi:MAG: DNA polymerase II large subunit [Thermoplasmata archaeon HGW-Thermoplasmata-1]|nr:MAG: DNA polymerase II large subunit [Thermoplasmata archaeon HGW-Thermoplasmata-1]